MELCDLIVYQNVNQQHHRKGMLLMTGSRMTSSVCCWVIRTLRLHSHAS